jgi:hypothetical protein
MVAPAMSAGFYMNACAQSATGFRSEDPADPAYVDIVAMQHPSGAKGIFNLRQLIHGSDNTPGGCGVMGTSQSDFSFAANGVPNAYMAKSLVSKQISGPGVDTLIWSYSYSPRWSFTGGCTSACISTTVESRPDNVQAEYEFGNDYTRDIGDLQVERLRRGNLLIQEAKYFNAGASVIYPSQYGKLLAPRGNPLTTQIRPLKETQLRRDGVLYKRSVESFDEFARPTKIVRSSALSS